MWSKKWTLTVVTVVAAAGAASLVEAYIVWQRRQKMAKCGNFNNSEVDPQLDAAVGLPIITI